MKEELIFKAAELVVMVISILIARYFIPWLKEKVQNEKVQKVAEWVEYAVLWAEQVYSDRTGATRKKLVLDFVENLVQRSGIGMDVLTTEQIEVLIEAAVRAMNIELGKYDEIEPAPINIVSLHPDEEGDGEEE